MIVKQKSVANGREYVLTAIIGCVFFRKPAYINQTTGVSHLQHLKYQNHETNTRYLFWFQPLAEFEMFAYTTKFSILLINFFSNLFLFSVSLNPFVDLKSLCSTTLKTNCSQIFNLSNIRMSFSSVNLMFCCSLPIFLNKICLVHDNNYIAI